MGTHRILRISAMALALSFGAGAFVLSPGPALAQEQKAGTGDNNNAKPESNPPPEVQRPTLPPQKPETPPFHSPFNGDKPSTNPPGGEEKDFTDLLGLFDTMKDDESAVAFAKKCGSADDVKKAQAALDKATADFNKALAEYINGWSNFTYSGFSWYPGTGFVNKDQKSIESVPQYKGDKEKVMDALGKADKKQHVVGDCPEKTKNTTGGAGTSKPQQQGGSGKPKRPRRHGKKAVSEDSPYYMEGAPLPPSGHGSSGRSSSGSGGGDSASAPPPQEPTDEPRRPDLPQPPTTMPN